MMTIQQASIHKILVVKLRAIGDVLLSTIVLKNLRNRFPEVCIDFLTEKSSSEVVEGNPNVNSVLVFDSKKESGLSLIRDVRQRKYDLIIDLFGNPRSALVTYFSGAQYRVGFRFGWRKFCYNIVVEPRGGEVHNTEFNLDALRAIGVPITDMSISFSINEVDQKFADQFLVDNDLQGKFVVALNPGGGWYTKRWRVPLYAQLADRLIGHYKVKVVLIWGPNELQNADETRRLMRSSSIIIPPTNLKQLAAILKRCNVMITNDSGPMHIAAAMVVPTVAIFGPTNPKLQGPVSRQHEIVQKKNLGCLGCNLTKCPIGNPCMEELSIDEVFNAFERLVKKNDLLASLLKKQKAFGRV